MKDLKSLSADVLERRSKMKWEVEDQWLNMMKEDKRRNHKQFFVDH